MFPSDSEFWEFGEPEKGKGKREREMLILESFFFTYNTFTSVTIKHRDQKIDDMDSLLMTNERK